MKMIYIIYVSGGLSGYQNRFKSFAGLAISMKRSSSTLEFGDMGAILYKLVEIVIYKDAVS